MTSSLQVAVTRKLGLTHMAFYRGWLQGLPLRAVATLYLETGLDLRRAKSTLAWVQDTLRRAALRHGRPSEARLLRLRLSDTRAVTGQAERLPSIDDFREDVDPTSFYSYDELMALYLERYPDAGDRRAQRRVALLERQLRALVALEQLLVTEPVPADPIEAWLDSDLVKRLQAGQIHTLGELQVRIAARGYRWYTTVPQLGEIRARRLLAWLDAYRATLGAIPSHARKPPAQLTRAERGRKPVLATGLVATSAVPTIAPLEALLLPRQDERPDAANRPRDAARIAAATDRDAIDAWLRAKAGGEATRRAYYREAERLVLWAMIERGRTLAELTVDDASAYRDFLGMLGRVDGTAWPFRVAQADWCAPRATRRYLPTWRPFEGALSPTSAVFALKISEAFTRWLVDMRYLDFNIWSGLSKARASVGHAPELEVTRSLSKDQWATLESHVAGGADVTRWLRDQLLLRLALVTGLRRAELASARTGGLYAKSLKAGGRRWMLRVCGKGEKWRVVPIPDDVLALIRTSLQGRGLPPDPNAAPPETPIITNVAGQALTPGGVGYVIKTLFRRVAESLQQQGHADDATTFAKASAHWLRHTTGATLGDAGVPATQIQQLLGHASVATTAIYTGTQQDALYQAVVDVF